MFALKYGFLINILEQLQQLAVCQSVSVSVLLRCANIGKINDTEIYFAAYLFERKFT